MRKQFWGGVALKINHDMDVFVLFDYKKFSKKSAQLSSFLDKVLRKIFKEKISKIHGSRGYFQLTYNEYFFEVIPILNISKSEKAMNITDISPLHSKWVNSKTKNLKDEIRMAKQFCKAQGVYGAESYIGGFSGYVIEILIAKYGSFEKLLKASNKWKMNDVVDVENYYKGKDALFEINSSKHSPLIVIDPVDKFRNTAAALTTEKFSLFKKKAKEYLKKPNDKFFEKEVMSFDILKKKFSGKNLVYIEVNELEGKNDVVGSKLLKAFEFLGKKLNKFKLVKSGWDWEKFYFVVKKNKLDDFELRSGPPNRFKEDLANFKKKNKHTFVKSGKIYAKIKVEYPNLDDYIRNLFSDPYFKEKIKNIRKCTVL
jgi:tRNA nucleotidyltransferase (CCA-adding enzyme)